MNDELNRRAPAQPGPAAPTPDTFMGEPVLTRWKPLSRDDSRLALWQSMHKRNFGNSGDDKLMLEWLWEHGYALCQRVPDEVLNRRRAPAQPEPAALAFDASMPPEVAKWLSKHPPTNIRALQPEPAAPTDASRDAYEGCREDLLDWKHRALVAEENNRQLTRALQAEVNSPTFMGEAAAPPVVEPLGWTVADAADRLKNGNVVEVSLEKEQPDDVPLYLAATPPRAALGERTTQVLNDLQSALGMMLTFFGMDEDENSESVFDTARQAYQYAQIVLRPIEPHEREALAKLRSTLHQWHESAVAKGFDGVASMLDSVAAAPTVVEPDDMAQQLEDALDSAQFYRRRCESLQSWQSKMRDPERTIVCDILANGRTLDPTVAGNRYATPPRAALPHRRQAQAGAVNEGMKMEPISLPEPAILLSVDLPMLKGGAVRKQPFYTADQLRAAMEAERFACMEIAMAHAANKTPPYKPYEDTYLDGWQDAGNQIGWAIRDRGTT